MYSNPLVWISTISEVKNMNLQVIRPFEIDVELADQLPVKVRLRFNKVMPQSIDIDLIELQQLLMIFKFSSDDFTENCVQID
jgi:hypothetical protein